MLKIVYSNDTRQLAMCLAEKLQNEPLPPFEKEVIIVQSNELSRWLSLLLATFHGIAANIDYPFPSAYIWRLFRQIWPEVPLNSPYSKAALTWQIYAVLPSCLTEPEFEKIATYLGDEQDDLKRYQLAEKLADTFDQYLMYRPDWIAQWEQGECPHWQGKLWFKLTEHEDLPLHRANLLNKLQHLLKHSETPPVGLPARLSIFGLSALPPVYLQTFELLATYVDITLFYLSPSEDYWGELRDQKQLQREQLKYGTESSPKEIGHPLLASWGKQGQEFFRQLQATQYEAEDHFVSSTSTQMLGVLKQEMFELEVGKQSTICEDDDSIMIHVAHSPMREVEILHDQLLALFERHPEVSPTDIVVMTPDIEVYAPWIEAVFGTAHTKHTIPFSIADHSGKQESLLLESLYQLLLLPQSRFDIESILDLLSCPAILSRFELSESDLSWIRDWCQQTRIRWGMNSKDKSQLDFPESAANTWQAGLDRLLLGFAMPLNEAGQSWRLFDGLLSMDAITGERAQVVAKLCHFIDTLDQWRYRLRKKHSIRDWQIELNHCLDTFMSVENLDNKQFEDELLSVRTQLDRLVDSAELAAFTETVGIDIILNWLQSNLDAIDNSHRFLGHGITFCGMVPMRSIPFDVICLIGMNDADFPRRQPTLSFDLLAHHYREGDRSRRDDDRYLFLEAILSAQRMLYISYVGASIVDNSEIPPSVLVSELEDLLSERFQSYKHEDVLTHLVTHHPLQAFSRRYFDHQDPKLFSFNQTHCPPTVRQKVMPDWFGDVLPEPDDSWRNLSLEQLIRFFRHPTKFLLNERLKIQFELSDDELESREPFSIEGLEQWHLRQQVLESRLSLQSDEDLKSIIQASGILPQGHLGDAWFEQTVASVDVFVEKLGTEWPQTGVFNVPFDLTNDEFVLTGQLERISQQGQFCFQLANTKGKYLIAAWLQHLILNIVRPQGVNLETQLILQDKEFSFIPVTSPSQILSGLLKLYWQGCHQPLKLFDKASYIFANTSLSDKPEQAFKKANEKWLTKGDYAGECEDIYYQQVFTESALDNEFAEIAMQVYSPMYQHMKEGSQ